MTLISSCYEKINNSSRSLEILNLKKKKNLKDSSSVSPSKHEENDNLILLF